MESENEINTISLGEKDYPSLYKAANDLSVYKQRFFYTGLFSQLFLMTLVVLSSALLLTFVFFKTIQIILVIALLGLSSILFCTRTVKHWYSARALAESVKTLSWRYVMRAAPFDKSDEESKKCFCERLIEIVKQNKDLSGVMAPCLDSIQITSKMKMIRAMNAADRAEVYLEERVQDQHSWYVKKTKAKGRQNTLFTAIFLLIVAFALVYAVLQFQVVDAAMWPIDLAVTGAIGILTWIQGKKFSELKASYGQTSYEIALINSSRPDYFDDDTLADFVKETENAFSREHIQWVARKDY